MSSVDQNLAEQFAFSLVHADMNSQDFACAPSGHARPDEYSAGTDIVAGGDQRLNSGADSVLRESTSGGNAAVDAFLCGSRREAFGGVIWGEVTFGKKAEFGALKDLHLR